MHIWNVCSEREWCACICVSTERSGEKSESLSPYQWILHTSGICLCVHSENVWTACSPSHPPFYICQCVCIYSKGELPVNLTLSVDIYVCMYICMNVCMYMRPVNKTHCVHACIYVSIYLYIMCIFIQGQNVCVCLCVSVCWGYFLPFSVSLSHSQAASPTHSIHINTPACISTCVFHSLPCLWRGGRGALTDSPGDWCWIPVLLPATQPGWDQCTHCPALLAHPPTYTHVLFLNFHMFT